MLFLVTLGFILMDVVTGVIKAFKEKAFCSSVMREGLFHKLGSLVCMVFGVFVDYAQLFVGITIVNNEPVGTAICGYIILMETGSIIENICAINPEFAPTWLKAFFKKLNAND